MTMTVAMQKAMLSGAPRGLLVEINHPSGTGYFHTGIGKVTWNDKTYVGSGTLGSVSPLKQITDVSVQDVEFKMSGVDPETVSTLSEDVHNRSALAYLCCYDDSGNVVADPYLIVDAVLDTQSFNVDDNGTATININAHTGFYILDRAIDEAWSPENQHLNYPGDTGLDMIPSLVKQDLQWTPS